MNVSKISLRADHELLSSPSMSGGTKRPSSSGDADTNAKRHCNNKDSLEVAVKCEYHPIASLTPESISPLVKGTVTSILPWRTFTEKKVTCMNFRLGDESGEIQGIVYAPMNEDFLKDFKLRAEVVIENARVQRLRPEFRTPKDQFQLIVNNWTKISVTPAPPEPVETSIPALAISPARKPITPNSPSSRYTSSNQGVITIQQTSLPNSGFLITVHTPPSNRFAPINTASGSRNEYSFATPSGTSSISGSPSTASDRFGSINEVFSNGGLSEYGRLSSINEIQSNVKEGTTIDLIGIAIQVSDPRPQLTRKGSMSVVREITLRDDTCSEIHLAIWGPGNSIIPPNSVLLVKKAKVVLYNETKRLICLLDSVIVDPDIPEAHRLQKLLASLPTEVKTNFAIAEKKVPIGNYNFCSINDIQSKITEGTTIDVIGLVVQVEDTKTCTTRRGQNAINRDVTLSDDGCSEINLAIWGQEGDQLDIQANSVLAVKNATVILYNNNKKLSCLRTSVRIDPDIPECHRLKNILRIFPAVTEKEQLSAATAPRSFEISPIEVPLVTGPLHSIYKIHEEIVVGTKIDMIGFIVRMQDPKRRTTRVGNVAFLREVVLKDDSGAEIILGIWEAGMDNLPIPLESVLLVKNAKVIVYKQVKKLSCNRVCIIIDPDIPQAHRLKKYIEYAHTLQTQKIELTVPPDAFDDSKEVNATIGDTPKASKTDAILEESTTGSSGIRVGDLDIQLHQNPVQNFIRDDEWVTEAQRLKNLPQNDSVVTEKAESMAVVVAKTNSDVSSKEVPNITDRLYKIKRILSEIAADTKVDLIGITVRVSTPISRMSRKGHETLVRDVTLKDDSCSEIDVAIWESRENCSEIPVNSVLLIKNAAVVFYNEHKKLTCQRFSVSIDPDIPEARKLKKLTEDRTQTGSSISKEQPIESSTSRAKRWYTSIEKIQDQLSPGMTVNILAVVTHRDPVERLVQNNKDNYKAVIVIVDQTQRKITLTVWGPRALTLSDRQYWIVEGLNIRVHEFNGEKQLICTERLSTLNDEPEVEEVKVLRQWFENVWLKTEESYAAAAADYQSNCEKTGEDTQICRRAYPAPTSPDLATYTPINDIHERVSKDSIINVIGIVDWITPSRPSEKSDSTFREINVLDDSRKSIWVMVWGDEAPFESMCRKVVAMINVEVRVQDGVKHLVCREKQSLIFVDPCMERTQELLNWYKINAIDKIFVETIMSITANNLVFSKFKSGDKTSVIGVVVKIHESQYVERKPIRLDVSRKIELIDDSEETINLLMWGEQARDFNLPEETILLVTNVFVKDENRTCVCTAWSHFDVDPTEPLIQDKVNRLKIWWRSYKMQQPQYRTSIPTSRAAVDDGENPIAIIKKEPILEDDNYNEIVNDEPSDNFHEYLGEERQRWDFF